MKQLNLRIHLRPIHQTQFYWSGAFMRGVLMLVAGVIVWGLISITSALAVNDPTLANGSELFKVHCAGCHPQGGNIIRRGKTLKPKVLKRNGFNSVEAIAELVANGKNNMSAFSDRLSSEQITVISTYVLEQAEQGWR